MRAFSRCSQKGFLSSSEKGRSQFRFSEIYQKDSPGMFAFLRPLKILLLIVLGSIRSPKSLFPQISHVKQTNQKPRAFVHCPMESLNWLRRAQMVQSADVELVDVFKASNPGLESRSRAL
jgi:hypothetical protein